MEVAEKPKLSNVVGHPLRIEILHALMGRVASPAQLARELKENLGNVAYHVKRLEEAEAIELQYTEPANGSTEHFYLAVERPQLSDEESAALDPETRNRWSRVIWHLHAADVNKSLDSGVFSERPDHVILRFPCEVDEEGWRALNEVYTRAHNEAMEIHTQSAVRIAGGNEGIPTRVDSFVYEMP